MLRTFLVLALAGLLAACSSTTAKAPTGERLTLVQPSDHTLRRGASSVLDVMVRRYGFSDAVGITLEALPAGVALEEQAPAIPKDMAVGHFRLQASADAEIVSHHPVRITATGPSGLTVSEWFQVTVRE